MDTKDTFKGISVASIIDARAEKTPDKTALIVDKCATSFLELNNRIKSAAKYLAAKGIGPGSHVVTVAVPDVNYVSNMYAVLGLGATHIPVENRAPAQRLSEIAEAVDADFVISETEVEGEYIWIDAAAIDYSDPEFEWDPAPVSDNCSDIIFI